MVLLFTASFSEIYTSQRQCQNVPRRQLFVTDKLKFYLFLLCPNAFQISWYGTKIIGTTNTFLFHISSIHISPIASSNPVNCQFYIIVDQTVSQMFTLVLAFLSNYQVLPKDLRVADVVFLILIKILWKDVNCSK